MHKQAIRFLGLLAFCARVQHCLPASYYYRYGTAAHAGPSLARGGGSWEKLRLVLRRSFNCVLWEVDKRKQKKNKQKGKKKKEEKEKKKKKKANKDRVK
ncbi:hypothetical protein LI328DRAFT_134541 [Trichoderma asperelloides]|nr:hypothetical protein LI328DRAFT_134541 [Trichoderma asperelloides]